MIRQFFVGVYPLSDDIYTIYIYTKIYIPSRPLKKACAMKKPILIDVTEPNFIQQFVAWYVHKFFLWNDFNY